MRDKFKGTKGAWKVNKLEATDFYTERNEINYGEDGECVAEFVADDFDAKLIANAPELLNGLIHALEMCEDRVMPTENDLTIMAGRLKSIINKALT